MPDPVASILPKFVAPLEPEFQPAALVNLRFRLQAAPVGVPLVLALERDNGQISRYESLVFPEGHAQFNENPAYAERLVKFLLWARGGFKLYVGGPRQIGEYLRRVYAPDGKRQFDTHFMGGQVYERIFSIISCDPSEVPASHEVGKSLGRHLEGCRVGFDLGASDRKVSAVIDGQAVYSEEVIWEPRQQTDPAYHYRELMTAIQSAAGKLPRLDAIGGSSAGIIIDNRPMVASLFRGIPRERFGEIQDLFLRIQRELGVPVEVLNDGDVTALAGSMSLEDNGVLGIAMGSSEAVGYVDLQGNILGWLNELAFAPVDYHPHAPRDDWSRDTGVGSQYFSQQCVFRLAPRAGIELPSGIPDAEKLKAVQALLEAGHAGAEKIWQSMGIFLGYGLAHYADFYAIRHVLILGRCTSGRGGDLILEGARAVLCGEFPHLAETLQVQLPDEHSRRVGQSIAAASLPAIPIHHHDRRPNGSNGG